CFLRSRRGGRIRSIGRSVGHQANRIVNQGGATMNAMKNPRVLGTLAIIVLIGLAPAVFAQENYAMRVITVGMCAAIAVYGLNLILGFPGTLSSATCADLSLCEPRTSTLPYSPWPSVSSSSWSSVVGNP